MASTVFSGTSRFSGDFSAVIERSVGIASLGLKQMEQARQRSNNEITALSNVQTEVEGLRSIIASLASSVAANSLQSSSSSPSLLTVRSSGAANPASYRVTVMSLGSYTTAVGKTADKPVTSDPNAVGWVGAATTSLTLRTVDHTTATPVDTDLTIDLQGESSLQGVVNRINSVAGSTVQAAVVNLGTTDAPNYTITLQSAKLGKFALQLKKGSPPPTDVSGDMLDVDEKNAANPLLGTRAEYKINGATVQSNTRSITIAPDVTADLLKADAGQEISVEVKRSTSPAKTALKSFATAYNSLVSELDKMTGKNGALLGNSLVQSIRTQFRNALTQSFAGEFGSLAKIGVEFQRDGTLTVNDAIFEKEAASKFPQLSEFMGSATKPGLVKTLTDALNTVTSASGGGFLTDTVSSLRKSLEGQNKRIDAETERIENLTRDLQERLAKADAMIAQLEQQASYFTGMFEVMRTNQRSMS